MVSRYCHENFFSLLYICFVNVSALLYPLDRQLNNHSNYYITIIIIIW